MAHSARFPLILTVMMLAAVTAAGVAFAEPDGEFARLARSAGMPQVPGLRIVYLSRWAIRRRHMEEHHRHQTEGPAGSARAMAERQARNPSLRGVTLWVETDGTVYWSTPETAITTHGDGANRNDNKYIDNTATHGRVTR